VFYAMIWIDPDRQWMRFCFEREDVTLCTTQIQECFGFPESLTRLHCLCYGTLDPPCHPHGGVASGTAHAIALFRPPFTDGSRRSPTDFTPATKLLYELMRCTRYRGWDTEKPPLTFSYGSSVLWYLTLCSTSSTS
jgi:hypothetical protein